MINITLQLFHDGVRLAAGYEDGAVKIWDLKTSAVLHQVPAGVHQIRVTAIDTHPDDNLIASISTDGKIYIVYQMFSALTASKCTQRDSYNKLLHKLQKKNISKWTVGVVRRWCKGSLGY